MATEHDHDGAPAPERRSFLGVISGLIVAGVSTVLGVTIGRYSISPAFSTSNEQDWTDLGSLNEFAEGTLVKKNVIVSQDAGWGKSILWPLSIVGWCFGLFFVCGFFQSLAVLTNLLLVVVVLIFPLWLLMFGSQLLRGPKLRLADQLS